MEHLGTIAASATEQGYGGFPGAEIDGTALAKNGYSSRGAGIEFELPQLSPLSTILTAQLVVDCAGQSFTFESEFDFAAGQSAPVFISFNNLHLSRSGQVSSASYSGQSHVRKLKLFAKRSKNSSKSAEPIPLSFGVSVSPLSLFKEFQQRAQVLRSRAAL